MRVKLQDLFHSSGYGLWILKDRLGPNVGTYVAKPVQLEFEYKGHAFQLPEPTLEIPYQDAQEFLQSLCNALIEKGIRPNNDKTAGELEATKRHLSDLKYVVDKTLYMLEKNGSKD